MSEYILSNLSQNICFKLFQNDASQEFIEKRRKISQLSLSTESVKNDLNEKFIKLELNEAQNEEKNTSSGGSQKSFSPPHLIHIPRPIKYSPKAFNRFPNSNQPTDQILNENENFQPFKTLLLEQLGISKYLNLERDQNAEELLKQPHQILEQIQQKFITERGLKKNSGYYIYGVPANFDFLLQSSTALLKNQIYQQEKKVSLTSPSRIGKLTREQRSEKVKNYLEKKHNRQWNTIKYTARQKLADQRQRINGKFVKQPKFYNLTVDPVIQRDSSQQELDSRLTQSWEGHSDSKKSKDDRKQQNLLLKNSHLEN